MLFAMACQVRMLPNDHDGFDPIIQKMIRAKARRLSRRCDFSASETEDLEQDLALQLLKARTSFNPQRHWHAYAASVLRNTAANLMRSRQALKRGGNCTKSLQAACPETALIDSKVEREEARRTLTLDVQLVAGTLSDEEAEIMRLLMTQTISEVAASTGRTREAIYKIIRRLRRRFEKASMRYYL